jgi:hypothetical protein
MKKIILSLLLLSVGLSYGQNFYNFTVSQSVYTDLTTPTSINNGQVWDEDEFGPFSIPFSFSIYGRTVDQFMFSYDDFLFLTPNANLVQDTGVFYNSVSGAFIQDRTYSTASTSAISYKTEGSAGDRILKLEIKNAGLEDAVYHGHDEDHFYLSFQVWLYERGNIIEYRYGNHNITNLEVLDDEVLVGFEDDLNGSVLTGNRNQPAYQEFNYDVNPPDEDFYPTLNAFPASGTVYRFAPASIAGINTFSKKAFVLYPNPVQDNLHITKIESDANYEVFSVLGAKVLSGTISAGGSTINVENLDKGVYIIKIGNAVQKFIKH